MKTWRERKKNDSTIIISLIHPIMAKNEPDDFKPFLKKMEREKVLHSYDVINSNRVIYAISLKTLFSRGTLEITCHDDYKQGLWNRQSWIQWVLNELVHAQKEHSFRWAPFHVNLSKTPSPYSYEYIVKLSMERKPKEELWYRKRVRWGLS